MIRGEWRKLKLDEIDLDEFTDSVAQQGDQPNTIEVSTSKYWVVEKYLPFFYLDSFRLTYFGSYELRMVGFGVIRKLKFGNRRCAKIVGISVFRLVIECLEYK